jgi:CRP-like cAMP-binding protein
MKESVRDVVLKLKEDGSIFRLYGEEDLEVILPYLSLHEYPAGTTITRPGEVVDMLGVLVSGEVILEEEMKLKGNWTVLYDMKKGSILAHPSLFGADPPPVRVLTRKDCVFIGFQKDGFNTFVEEHPRLGVIFLREVIRVLFVRSRAMAERLADVF